MAVKEDKRSVVKIIRDYMAVLQENGISVRDIYLFGSYATGKFTEESDIDLAVFLDQEGIEDTPTPVNHFIERKSKEMKIQTLPSHSRFATNLRGCALNFEGQAC